MIRKAAAIVERLERGTVLRQMKRQSALPIRNQPAPYPQRKSEMKAFVVAMVLMLAISGIAFVSLGALPMSSQDTFTIKENVRL